MKESMKRLRADQVKLGFIGLGNMGSRIARRLVDHGYQVSAYDRDPTKAAEAIAGHGGVVAKSILEVARTSDVLLSSLTNDEAVRSVYIGPEGAFAGAQSGTVVLEMRSLRTAHVNCTGSELEVALTYRMSPSQAAPLLPKKEFSHFW
jgi:3-hydroxyisobutyrate dehydrogenase